MYNPDELDEEEETSLVVREDNCISALEELVKNDTNKITEQIVRENDAEEIKRLTQLFNMNIAKKNVLRVNKLNELVDYTSDEMLNRLKNGDEISNKDLLGFLTSAQGVLDKSSKIVDGVQEAPAIQYNTQNNITITTNENELTREERENVLSIVSAILNNKNEGSN